MFEQTFKNLDNVLRKEAGCSTELDYTEQTSWMLFLKYLDDLEQDRRVEAELDGSAYSPIIDEAHRWGVWAAPKTADGEFDHNTAKTGDDLIEYVDGDLFPYLSGFRQGNAPDTIEYKIGEIFGEIRNRFRSGYNLRNALELVDQLEFNTQDQKHELSDLYETRIKNMGNAGRNGGEYYTPRPLIRAMVKVLDPQIGETVYDGACGSAGFLCEAYVHMQPKAKTTGEAETLQKHTFYGVEKKSLAYVIAIMNMILHGIAAPNILHDNTLETNLADIQPKDRHDVILANPPFGGSERAEIKQNFNIQSSETAFLFLEHFIKKLKAGGRAAVVIKNTFLSNTDRASTELRRHLTGACNLHTVLNMPDKSFQGTGAKTIVLFFDKGEPTRSIWYYDLDPGRSLGKTDPLNDADFEEFLRLQGTWADTEKSWVVPMDEVDAETFDLSVRNPNKVEERDERTPWEILDEIAALDREAAEAMAALRAML